MEEKQKISKTSIIAAIIFFAIIIVAVLLCYFRVFNDYRYSESDRKMIDSAIKIIDDFENGTLSAKEASTKMKNLTNLAEKQADDKTLSATFSSVEISLSLSDNKNGQNTHTDVPLILQTVFHFPAGRESSIRYVGSSIPLYPGCVRSLPLVCQDLPHPRSLRFARTKAVSQDKSQEMVYSCV